MRKKILLIALFVGIATALSCGGSGMVIPEMKAFMNEFDGTYQAVESALEKYGPGVDVQDMDIYDLQSPKVVDTEQKGEQICYTMEAKAGITVRTYEICWEGGKIRAIVDKGMR